MMRTKAVVLSMCRAQNLAFNAEELREKVLEEYNAMQVWDVAGEDRSSEDLAMDKRMKIEERIQKMEEDGKPKEGGEKGASDKKQEPAKS
jgi:hypothetical protein